MWDRKRERKKKQIEKIKTIQVLIVSILERGSTAEYSEYTRLYCIIIIKLGKR